jgi:hypothetical protein
MRDRSLGAACRRDAIRSELPMRIDSLANHRHWVADLAGWQFDYWGRLTGFDTFEQYIAALERWGAGQDVPAVLVAADGGELLGLVNLVRSEMEQSRGRGFKSRRARH